MKNKAMIFNAYENVGFLDRYDNGAPYIKLITLSRLVEMIGAALFGKKSPLINFFIFSCVFGFSLGTTLHALTIFPWSSYNDFTTFFSGSWAISIIVSILAVPVVSGLISTLLGAPACFAYNQYNLKRFDPIYETDKLEGETIYKPTLEVEQYFGIKKS